jgi:hypothetical protein
LEELTRASVIHDYLDAWQALCGALAENRSDLLDRSFVGYAGEQLADSVQQQLKSGIKTLYRDVNHSIDLVFFSPEGMSIELIDNLEYEVQIAGQPQAVERVRARYVAVLTPTETRWKVRILQAAPE